MTRIRIPMDRKEWVRRLDLEDWAKSAPEEIERYGSLIESVKTTAVDVGEDDTDPPEPPGSKIVGAVALLAKDSKSLDEWIDNLNGDIPVSSEDWAVLFESAAWVIYQTHERNLEKEANNGDA